MTRFPLLLPLAALSAGIITARCLGASSIIAATALLFVTTLLFLLSLYGKRPERAIGTAKFFPPVYFLLFLSLGYAVFCIKASGELGISNLESLSRHYPYAYGTVEESRQKTTHAVATVRLGGFETAKGEDSGIRPNSRLLLRTDGVCFNRGDRIVFPNRLQTIKPSGNRFADTYPDYMRDKGIVYEEFASDNEVKVYGYSHTLFNAASCLREEIIILLEKSNLERGTRDFLIALSLGEKGNLDSERLSELRNVGLSHIIALSGMHIGIIAGIFAVLFFPFSIAGHRKWRWGMVIIAIWCYTFITGIATSAVRAAIMCSFALGALLLERRGNTLNSLFAAAFIILAFDPLALWQPGFQLSFLSTTSIIVVSLYCNPINRHTSPTIYRLFSILSIAIAVFMIDACLVAYHFHTLPLSSLPPNIAATLAMPCYLGAGLLYILLLTMGCDWNILASLLETGTKLLDSIVKINGTSHLDALYPHPAGVIMIYCVIALVFVWIILRKRRIGYFTLPLAVFSVVSVILLPSAAPSQGYIVQTNSYAGRIAVSHSGSEKVLELPAGKIAMFRIFNDTIAWIDRHLTNRDHLQCKLVVLGKGFKGNLEELGNHVKTREIAVLKNVYPKKDSIWREEASRLGIRLHSIRKQGPYRRTL